MRKIFKIIFLTIFVFSLSITPIFAEETTEQDENASENITEITKTIVPIIISEDSVPIAKKTVFYGSDSKLIEDSDAEPLFQWDFGDGSMIETGKEVFHEFISSGKYIISLTITQGNDQEKISKEIFAYERKTVLITDQMNENNFIIDQAARNGVFLTLITAVGEDTDFLTQEKLTQQLVAKSDLLKSADMIMFYTTSSIGLQAFTSYFSTIKNTEQQFDLTEKLLIKISDMKMSLSAKLTQQSFEVLEPKFILLTRKEAFNPIFEAKDILQILNGLESRVIEYKIIDKNSRPSNILLLSKLSTYFILNGIPSSTIYLILAFPFITFVIAFARQVIGISTFGVYAPALTALSFLILGFYFGITVLFVVIGVSYIIRRLLNKIELLYIPRVSLLLSFISLSFLVIIWSVLYLGSPISISLAIFPMLVMSTISEKFTSAQAEQGFTNALISTFETVIIATVAYSVVAWQPIIDLLTGLPELVILPLIGDVIVGRFSGLRLTEYFRFRSILSEGAEEE
ncbi:hypothetical protein A2335_04155 [Candidatus Peregrinibacteria bacterium RIFOXYB2_FULL_32_7]|nr:MAG: hypothetical protein A2335_04155 [Candidatus Peregrinibacteria bacterium RIFOXYB2_FULL_32_7]